MLKLIASASPVALATLKDADRILGVTKSANAVKVAIAESKTLAASVDDLSIASANRALTLRRFQAAVIHAYNQGAKHGAVKAAIQETLPGVWPKVKDAFSKAVKLADAINVAAYPVPTPKANDRKRITVAGHVVTMLDKSHLPALADPQFGDTPVSTLLSKVIGAKAEATNDATDDAAEPASASDDFLAELQRRLSDPVAFAELLPMFDTALAAHTGKGTTEDMIAAEPERMIA